MKQLLLDMQPPPSDSFQNFKMSANAEAVLSIQDAIRGKAPSRFVYLWGATGSGKTHLLNAAKSQGAFVADNVHLLDNDSQIELFNLYNHLKDANGVLITAGLHAPSQMNLRTDLATRLAWGLVYQLQPLSDIEKREALQQHASERGMKLPDEVVDYCLRYLRRDLPSLMATLEALDNWSLQTKKPVTVPMLKKLLQLDLGM